MDPQAHFVSTSSTPMETEDVLPSTSAIPLTVQHSANPAESNTLRNQITTLNMMDPCAHIPSTSSTPMETEDALPSTSAIPTTAEKNALRNREYRKRVAAIRTPEQAAAFARKAAERQRKAYHLRRAANLALASGTVETTTIVQTSAQRKRASRQRQAERVRSAAQPSTSSNQAAVHQEQPTWSTKWSSSIHRFKSTFLDNDFGHTCSVCDRLWFRNDLKAITAVQMQIISDWCVKENRQVHAQEFTLVCANCKRSLNTGKLPSLAKMNGFTYPEVPPGLPPLDPISERLISPRLPFMQVRRLRHDFSYGIIGQVINVPVDVQEMVKCLPRQLDEDEVINVNIKRNLAHKTNYVSGYTSKRTIKEWLDVLQKSSLYRLYDIKVDLSKLQLTVPSEEILPDEPGPRIEAISAEYTTESEILAARQHTLLWNEEDCLDIAPGHRATPLNIIYDRHAEELSFPAIYFGEPRRFNMGVSVTPYMMATSEIRRSDRRGATPQKILYVAMKILRLRMVDGIYSTFRKVPVTENVTRRMLEDPEFLKEFVIQNLAFMKSVPNSVQYWASRKRDLFAMLRQLGKPTIFLTLSANEVRWLTLLNLLLKLSNKYPGKVAEDLNTSERCSLVSDDPVTCCIYFHKLVGTLMNMLKAKSNYNPFGQYFVKDYFLRIEFQHRGSPHAHILLWLNNDPLETVSENMPNTIELVEKLSSVAKEDVPNDTIYSNQIHKHTFTCTKRGETTCRFGIPYWPMLTTRVLVPMPKTDGSRVAFQKKGKELRTSLSDRTYASMDDFLRDHSLTFDAYLDVVRSTLRRPTLLFKRNFDQLMTNTFNPYLAGEINSNIDIQFVLDDYSCAQYVVEYVNKSARGMGNLNRELAKMMQEHPDRDYTGQLKALSIKLLNAVEMSAQEAAWYLLRQSMSETSRQVVYIPTVWPSERQRCRKRRVQMNREGIDADSTDVWTKNIIQRYEERPPSLEPVYLAEFASWYAKCQDFIDNEDDVDVHEYENLEPETEKETTSRQYRRRQMGRIIRYRHYEVDEIVNYQREMVLLYLPFRNELSEIVDCNKFLQLYNDNKDVIMERRQIYEKNRNIDSVLQELEAMMILQNSNSTEPAETEARRVSVEQSSEGAEYNDDVNQIVPREGFSTSRISVPSVVPFHELPESQNSMRPFNSTATTLPTNPIFNQPILPSDNTSKKLTISVSNASSSNPTYTLCESDIPLSQDDTTSDFPSFTFSIPPFNISPDVTLSKNIPTPNTVSNNNPSVIVSPSSSINHNNPASIHKTNNSVIVKLSTSNNVSSNITPENIPISAPNVTPENIPISVPNVTPENISISSPNTVPNNTTSVIVKASASHVPIPIPTKVENPENQIIPTSDTNVRPNLPTWMIQSQATGKALSLLLTPIIVSNKDKIQNTQNEEINSDETDSIENKLQIKAEPEMVGSNETTSNETLYIMPPLLIGPQITDKSNKNSVNDNTNIKAETENDGNEPPEENAEHKFHELEINNDNSVENENSLENISESDPLDISESDSKEIKSEENTQTSEELNLPL